MSYLKFIIDKNYDIQMTRAMLQMNDPAGLESRSNLMGLELSFAEAVNKGTQEAAIKLIEPVIGKRYEAIGNKLDSTREWYEKSWSEINDDFFNFVVKRTGHNWQYTKYFCVVSVIHHGLSNWNGNKIVRIWSENPFTMRRITAHELIISHIFSIFHNDPKYKDILKDNQIWKIAEISAWCLTGLEPAIIKFWPWVPKHRLFYTNHNYPQLVPLQLKLKEIYLKEKDFNKFLSEAVEMVKSDK